MARLFARSLTSIRASALIACCSLAPAVDAQFLCTNLSGDVTFAAFGNHAMFDLTVNVGVELTMIQVDGIFPIGSSVDVWVGSAGTYVGNEWNGIDPSQPTAPWPPSPTGSTASILVGTSAAVILSGVTLAPGTYPVRITFNLSSPTATVGNYEHSNDDISIRAGAVLSSSPPFFSANPLTPNRSVDCCVQYNVVPGYATNSTYGSGCGGTEPSSFYEAFDGGLNSNDLAGSGFTLLPPLPGESYDVFPFGSGIVAPVGAPIPFTTGAIQQIALPVPLPTEFGQVHDIWVCWNGFVSFESTTDTGVSATVAGLLNGPNRVAPFWREFMPGWMGGTVHAEEANSDGRFYVTWTDVFDLSGTGGPNTFQLCLDTVSGMIECNYGAMASTEGIVGYSPGGGAHDPGCTNISAIGGHWGFGMLSLGAGIPPMTLETGARPVLGQSASCTLTGIPATGISGGFRLGFVPYMPGWYPLDVLGMEGCELLVGTALFTQPFTVSGPTEEFSLPILGLAGFALHVQPYVIAPGVNSFGLVTSNAITWHIDSL